MLKAKKTTKAPTTTKTQSSNIVKDEKEKAKTSLTVDKKTDKKLLSNKSDLSLRVKNVKPKNLIKTKSSPSVGSNATQKTPLSKKNVMNIATNVTVSSPPSSATKVRNESVLNVNSEIVKSTSHSRTRTRTIAPEDSLLYQRQISQDLHKIDTTQHEIASNKEPVKEPIAFEINFEEPKKTKKEEIRDDDYIYESDFESYESDFEPEVSSSSLSASSSEKLNELSDVDKAVNTESEPTTQTNKEQNDSGNFEISAKKSAPSAQFDSIDDTIYSHDSGISYEDSNTTGKRLISPKLNELYKRGKELMKKITFDEMDFNIFEFKPIPYEVFMSVYGERNMEQVTTQTEAMSSSAEAQTNNISTATMWTQYPAKFTKIGLESVSSKFYLEEKLGVGEAIAQQDEVDSLENEFSSITKSILDLNHFSRFDEKINFPSTKSIDEASLKSFLQNSEMTIMSIMESKSSSQEYSASKMSVSRGFFILKFEDVDILRKSIITKVYTNLFLENYVITVHSQKDSLQHLICLWNVLNVKRPIKIFCSWNEVKCIEIHQNCPECIIGGCSDGTICLWDIQECNDSLDHNVTSAINPCEIVSLAQSSDELSLDNAVSLKSLPHREFRNISSILSQTQASQICSLHENGVVTIWTIMQAEAGQELDLRKTFLRMDFSHITNRFKLIRNLSIDIKPQLGICDNEPKIKRKSAFEKTRYYFENDLFNDKILRELQEIDSERLQKSKSLMSNEPLKAKDFEVNLRDFFVASDSNFIMTLPRLNLGENIKKLLINDFNFIAPSAIKLHPINQNILAIGQSDGNVKFLKMAEGDFASAKNGEKQLRKSTQSDIENMLSKSCAFQNIVEKDKKLYNETQSLNNLEMDELKAFLVDEALSQQFCEQEFFKNKLKITFNRNIFNAFNVCPGSVSLIEFNKTGELMFVLINKKLKIFNCWNNSELEHQENQNIFDMKCAHGADNSEYLILLTSTNRILINKLKN